MLSRLLLLAIAGACGTLARYGLAGLVQRIDGGFFPFGTLAVNALGCLLFGCVWSLSEERMLISGADRFVILTGFMGAFTTFSTYAFETTAFLRDSQWVMAGANMVLQNALGIACVFLGFVLARSL